MIALSRSLLGITARGNEPIEKGLCAIPYGDSDELGHFVGVEFVKAQFNRGKKICPRFDEHQGFGGGFDRPLPAVNRIDIVNDIDTGRGLLGNQSARDAASFLWRAGRGKGHNKIRFAVIRHNLNRNQSNGTGRISARVLPRTISNQ